MNTTKQERGDILARVARDILKHDPYFDRWLLARLLLEASKRFLAVPS